MSEECKSSLNPGHVGAGKLIVLALPGRGNACGFQETPKNALSLFFRKMFLLLRSKFKSILPEFLAVILFGGMVVIFLFVLADVACLDAQNFTEVTQ